MRPDSLIWITARDGSVHATRPPIYAARQATLCARSYDRLDLRVRDQAAPGHGPANACRTCCDAAALAASAPLPEIKPDHERKPPLWP